MAKTGVTLRSAALYNQPLGILACTRVIEGLIINPLGRLHAVRTFLLLLQWATEADSWSGLSRAIYREPRSR